MLSNTINLSVDVLNNGTIVSQEITRSEESLNRTRYKFPTHTLISRDVVDFYRTPNKKAGNFNGVAKSAFKLTNDIAVPGVDASTTLTAPMIGEASFSLPVGTSSAQAMLLRQRMVAILDNAIAVALTEQLEV